VSTLSGPAADGVAELETALSELVRLLNRPSLSRVLMARAGVDADVGPLWALGRIDRLGACRPSELAASVGVDASTITHRIQALERAGYLERAADPGDGRACVVSLSPEGRAALDRFRQARRALYARLLASWTAEEQRQLTGGLERLRTALEAEASRL
jgi:DNA-binding MarR family transcriptional regulator